MLVLNLQTSCPGLGEETRTLALTLLAFGCRTKLFTSCGPLQGRVPTHRLPVHHAAPRRCPPPPPSEQSISCCLWSRALQGQRTAACLCGLEAPHREVRWGEHKEEGGEQGPGV